MDSTKNFFDAWFNSPANLMGNIVDTSQKLKDSFNSLQQLKHDTAQYRQWIDQQQQALHHTVHDFTEQLNHTALPNLMGAWLEMQFTMSQDLLQILKKHLSTQLITHQTKPMKDMQAQWNQMYEQFSQQFGQTFQHPMTSPEGLSSFLQNSRTYLSMLELWQPIYKFIQSNSLGIESFQQMLDMNKYNALLSQMMGQSAPLNLGQLQDYFKQYNDFFGQRGSAFGDEGIQAMVGTGLGLLLRMHNFVTGQLYNPSGPAMTMMPAGRDKEMTLLSAEIQQLMMQYYVRATEIQTMVQVQGYRSLENVVRKLMEKVGQSAQVVGFDEFYGFWISTFESDMIQLFASDAYSRAQGEMVNASMLLKTKLDKQMEYFLAPLPIVPRSEVDEMNKTIYELRQKIRQIEQQLQQQAPTRATTPTSTAKATPAEKTPTPKASEESPAPKTTTPRKTSTRRKTEEVKADN
jgi:hypothetical protein